MSLPRRLAWMVLILLVASFLRWHDLPHVPPGLTHDEADHGLDAWGVVQGVRPIYFTVGYGREPLYDYSTAVLMLVLGPHHLAGRLTSAFFSLLLIAGAYAWVRQAFGGRPALLTAAGLALGFWPLMTARQALRSETLPALFVLTLALYWRGWRDRSGAAQSHQPFLRSPFLWSGLLLGLSFYTYIPARVLWLIFPALLIVSPLLRRAAPRRETLLMLALAALVGLPLFYYLLTNPQAEVRIAQLAQPLRQAARGDFALLWGNIGSGLGILTVSGDTHWRYNIPGRPLLPALGGLLFYGGLAWSLWRLVACLMARGAPVQGTGQHACRRAPAFFAALSWLALGLAPALVTGRDLSTTQAIGMQPVLYLFPALALAAGTQWLEGRWAQHRAAWLLAGVALLLGGWLLASTWRAYFQVWAVHPAVAVQYEAELVSIARQVSDVAPAETPVAISTDAPGLFHDPGTARFYLQPPRALRWFDGRSSLLLPAADGALLVFSEAAPLHPALQPYLDALQAASGPPQLSTHTLQLTHTPARLLQLYPQFSTEINTLSTELSTDVRFGDALRLLAYELSSEQAAPGAVVQVVTVWQALRPPQEELMLFTHLTGGDGAPLAQDDRLDAPTHSWQAGDVLIQLHTLQLPTDLAPGEYPLAVGLYDAADWRRRLPLFIAGEAAGDSLQLAPLAVQP